MQEKLMHVFYNNELTRRRYIMSKYTITKTFTFYDEDILSVISSAIYDIGYWSCIDNDTDVWHKTSDSMDDGRTFEDVFFEILKNGQAVELIDVEDDEEVWELTLDKLIHGMQLAVEQNYWDGDVDSLDGSIGDAIFQMSLFSQIVFG
jgi:hypothetical protein